MVNKATHTVRLAASTGKYAPNLSDPRTRAKTLAKIKVACGWAFATCHDKETVISKARIDKNLGRSNDNLGNYLRRKLLICTDHHIKYGVAGEKGCAKKYILNETGYRELMQVLYGATLLPSDFVPSMQHAQTRECVQAFLHRTATKHITELASLTFQMEEKGSCPRLFHGLQHLRKEIKTLFWEGRLPYNYDIQCCAPTLIYQQARALRMADKCAAIDALLENPKTFRTELASRIGISYKDAKTIINALFCGAVLGRSPHFELFRLVRSFPKMNALRDDPWIDALRKEIKACWRCIGNAGVIPRKRDKRGRLIALSCDAKWQYYFGLERFVLDEILEYLAKREIKFFPEHDGFRTDKPVDTQAIQAQVSGALDFSIRITSEEYAPDSSQSSAVVSSSVLSLPVDRSHAQTLYESQPVEAHADNYSSSSPLVYDGDLQEAEEQSWGKARECFAGLIAELGQPLVRRAALPSSCERGACVG
jgi:hypothetical protein